MGKIYKRLFGFCKTVLNYLMVFFFRRNIKSILNGIKRGLYNLFHSREIKLALNEDYNIAGNKSDLLVAFSVLFSEGIRKTDTYYIPDSLVSNYTDLLGVNIEKRKYITNDIITNSNNFKDIKVIIFNKLKEKFEKERDFNSLAFLEYINSMKKRDGVSPQIVKDEYSIVPWHNTLEAKKNTKRIYTFGQRNCEVIFCSFDNEIFIMTHYSRGSHYEKDFKENYIQNIYKRVAVEGKQFDSICFYVVANYPYMICNILSDTFSDYPQKKIFYHVKDASMVYAVKASIGKNHKLAYFRAPAFLRSGLTGMYSTGAYMVPFGPFKRISFELFQ